MASVSAITIRNAGFSFSADKPVFQNLSLEIDSKKSPLVILGPSGCGKTTLLRLIAGLVKPETGEILIDGKTVSDCRVSMVFQEPRLLPWKTALENVSLPIKEKMGTQAAERARHFLRMVSMEDKAAALPAELSGGQQQRVNLARAFAAEGNILLLDEPFQSLDIPLRIELMDLTLSLLADCPRLAIMVSHDPREALYTGNRILVLGESPRGIIHDEEVILSREDRGYGSTAQGAMEQKLIALLR
ncbi:MAG: ABC transporter ATP-binding protein [Treponema sp.]|jgi:NitT/TauT family transport system ATP-binding protein|nr:ABC transporter ATP-binding protein [Treponema sp.]